MTTLSFYERTEVAPGTDRPWRYELLEVHQPPEGYITNYLPNIGDCVRVQQYGCFRVMDRMLEPVEYGSPAWPLGYTQPTWGHHYTLILERIKGGGVLVGQADTSTENGSEEDSSSANPDSADTETSSAVCHSYFVSYVSVGINGSVDVGHREVSTDKPIATFGDLSVIADLIAQQKGFKSEQICILNWKRFEDEQ